MRMAGQSEQQSARLNKPTEKCCRPSQSHARVGWFSGGDEGSHVGEEDGRPEAQRSVCVKKILQPNIDSLVFQFFTGFSFAGSGISFFCWKTRRVKNLSAQSSARATAPKKVLTTVTTSAKPMENLLGFSTDCSTALG